MRRLQQARLRQERERQLQAELQRVLDEFVERCPAGQSQALSAIIEYGVTGLAAVRRPVDTNHAMEIMQRHFRRNLA